VLDFLHPIFMNKRKYKEKIKAVAISYLGLILILAYLILTK